MSHEYLQDGFRELESLSRRTGVSRRAFLGRAAALGLLPIAAQLWANGASAQTPVRGGFLKMGLDGGSTTDSPDPRKFIGTAHPSQIHHCIYDTLTNFRPGGGITPMLATSWEPNENATTWRFNLRQGVTFHDGRPFTANDVAYSIRYQADEANIRVAVKTLMQSIKGIKIEGPHAIVLELEAPNFDLPVLLAQHGLAIIPEDQTDFSKPVGTGPYKLELFEAGQRAELQRYDGFWSNDEGHFDQVQIRNIGDAGARTNAVRNGDVDVVSSPDVATAKLLAQAPGIRLDRVSGNLHRTLPMRFADEPFGNTDLRLAIAHGVNRGEFVEKAMSGFGVPGNDNPIGENYYYFNDTLGRREFDPDKAKFHLAKSGISQNSGLELIGSPALYAGAQIGMELVQASLGSIGLDIKLKTVPQDGYWSDIWKKVPWSISYWNGFPTTSLMLSYYSVNNKSNEVAFHDERYEDLIAQAATMGDSETRRSIYFEAQDILHQKVANVVLAFGELLIAGSDKLGHAEIGGLAAADDNALARRWWWNES